MPPDLAPWLTLVSSNFPCLEYICIWFQRCSSHWSSTVHTYHFFHSQKYQTAFEGVPVEKYYSVYKQATPQVRSKWDLRKFVSYACMRKKVKVSQGLIAVVGAVGIRGPLILGTADDRQNPSSPFAALSFWFEKGTHLLLGWQAFLVVGWRTTGAISRPSGERTSCPWDNQRGWQQYTQLKSTGGTDCKYLSGTNLPRIKLIRRKLFPDRYLLRMTAYWFQ